MKIPGGLLSVFHATNRLAYNYDATDCNGWKVSVLLPILRKTEKRIYRKPSGYGYNGKTIGSFVPSIL